MLLFCIINLKIIPFISLSHLPGANELTHYERETHGGVIWAADELATVFEVSMKKGCRTSHWNILLLVMLGKLSVQAIFITSGLMVWHYSKHWSLGTVLKICCLDVKASVHQHPHYWPTHGPNSCIFQENTFEVSSEKYINHYIPCQWSWQGYTAFILSVRPFVHLSVDQIMSALYLPQY